MAFTDVDTELPHAERQATLFQNWGFKCSCSLCQQDTPLLRASDDRLSRIQSLKQILGSQLSLSTVNELLSLYDQERLVAPKYSVWESAAYAHNELGEKAEAVHFGSLVHEYAIWLTGPESIQTKFWGEFIQNPEQHPSWRSRMR
jgi:hypothetical protein